MLQKTPLLTLLVVALAFAPCVRSQGYPDKPIRVIVAYAPGATDAAARAVTRPMAMLLGQAMVIENKPGAEAAIGSSFVAKSAPDGYTILYTPSSSMLRPHLSAETLYDPLAMTAIGRAVGTVNILVISAGHPAKTVSELISYAKAHPGEVTFGSVGGGSAQLGGEFLSKLAGVEFLHVPYKGTSPAMLDLMAGRLTFIFSGVGHVLSNVKNGKLRVLSVTGEERHFQLPDIPTMTEAGIRNFDLPPIWHAFVGPLKLQPAVVSRLNQALRTSLADPDAIKAINALGYEPIYSTPEQLQAQMRSDYDNWAKIVKAAGISKNQQ